MEIPEHLRTFRLIGRTTAFRAVRVYMHPMLKVECVIGHAINDGERRTNARIVDVTGLGGTYLSPGHENCGTRSNMHAGCVECCTCAECGFDRAARLRRHTLDRELEEVGAVVIRVEDLGAALEARHRGGVAVEHAGEAARSPLVVGVFQEREIDSRIRAKGAAHLARVALGEVER